MILTFGARPLKRAIQKYLEDIIADEIVNANLVKKVMKLRSYDNEKEALKIKIIKPKKKNT